MRDSGLKPEFYVYILQTQVCDLGVAPGFQNPSFQFPVSNTNWYFIFQVTPRNGTVMTNKRHETSKVVGFLGRSVSPDP